MSNSERGHTNISILIMLSTPTGSQQRSFLSLLVFIQPIQHLYPETLQPLINLPFPSATPASRRAGTSRSSSFPLHRRLRPGSPGPSLKNKQACHFSSHYFDRIIFPWGSSTNYASPGSTHSRYPCCLLFLHCSPAFAWLRKPRWHHRTL